MISVNRVVIIFGPRVPNLCKVGLNWHYRDLIGCFLIYCVGISVMRRGTNVLNVVSQDIYSKLSSWQGSLGKSKALVALSMAFTPKGVVPITVFTFSAAQFE